MPWVLLTLIPKLPVLYALFLLNGLGGGGSEPVCNIGCLQIWRGRSEGGSFMHAIHFGFSLGTVVGPILATPFLSTPSNNTAVERNVTFQENITASSSSVPGVVYLYVIVGLTMLASGTGFIYPAVKAWFVKEERQKRQGEASGEINAGLNHMPFVLLMCIFFFCYESLEVIAGTYLAPFTVKSDIDGTRIDGAFVTAIFWGTFAASRFASIFLAIYLNPLATLMLSLSLCLCSGVGLIWLGEYSLTTLQVLASILGCGMAPLFAGGFLWMEKYIIVTNRIGAACSLAAMAAYSISPVIVGTFIVAQPMTFAYVILGIVALSITTFGIAWMLGEGMARRKEYENVEGNSGLYKQSGYVED